MNRIAKVIYWRVCSISITLFATYVWTGSIKEASGFTIFLHTLTMAAHWIFENVWDKKFNK